MDIERWWTNNRRGVRIKAEYELMRHMLPEQIDSVLDVGCGMGGMDIMLARYHGTKDIHLLDGSGIGNKRNGWNKLPPEPWRDVNRGVEFVRFNLKDLPGIMVTGHNHAEKWPRVSLITSFWSWGFHYPIETYLDEAERIAAPLVVDVRRKVFKQTIAALGGSGYRHIERIDFNHKAMRVLCLR